MMNLAEYRRKSHSLADFLPWAALVETGVVLNKDGAFQRTARFRGPDLDSATPAELVAIRAPVSASCRSVYCQRNKTEGEGGWQNDWALG